MPIPIDPSIIAGAAGAASQSATSIANAGFQLLANRASRKWNEKMYAQQRQDALTDAAMQNEWNSPKAQMARLKEAGLNPNLVYGNGATSQAAVSPRSASPGSYDPKAPQLDANGIANTMSHTVLQAQQIANMKSEQKLTDQKALEAAANTRRVLAMTPGVEADSKLKTSMAYWSDEIASETLNLLAEQANKTRFDAAFTANQDQRARETQEQNLKQMILNQELTKQNIKIAEGTQEQQKQQIKKLVQDVESGRLDNILKKVELRMKQIGIYPSDPAYLRTSLQLLNMYKNGTIVPDSLIKKP